MALSRTQILEAEDITSEPVNCPEWGGEVIVKGLTGTERDAFENACRQIRPTRDGRGQEMVPTLDNVRARLVVKCVVDDDGVRLFTDQDANALGKKSGKVLDRVYDVAARLSGLSEADVEELAKNSEADPLGDSPSDSPESSDAPSPSF